MIENMSQKDITALLKELGDAGYVVKGNEKASVLKSEAEKAFGCKVFMTQDIRKSITDLADRLTDNYEEKRKNTVRRSCVPLEIDEEYRKIVSGILEVMRPYFGMTGFCEHR